MGCGSYYIKGWATLIEVLNRNIAIYDPDYTIDQIKEKFGALRYYVSGVDSEQGQALIQMAEMLSETFCIDCGAIGQIQTDEHGWYRPVCSNCKADKKVSV